MYRILDFKHICLCCHLLSGGHNLNLQIRIDVQNVIKIVVVITVTVVIVVVIVVTIVVVIVASNQTVKKLLGKLLQITMILLMFGQLYLSHLITDSQKKLTV